MKKTLCIGLFILLYGAAISSWAQERQPLSQLVSNDCSAWIQVQKMAAAGRNPVEILPKTAQRADTALLLAQQSTCSLLGAIIYETGGILVDKGWIRILGSGCSRLDRSLPEWNKGKSILKGRNTYAFLLVADDVLGGFFGIKTAVSNDPDSSSVYYFGPNSLKWKPIGFNYRTFLKYCFSGNIQRFYDDFRWEGWQQDVEQLDGNHVISCYPLLWTKEGRELKVNRKVVPIQKIWEAYPQQTKILAQENFSVAK
jgi:hypothetical protein